MYHGEVGRGDGGRNQVGRCFDPALLDANLSSGSYSFCHVASIYDITSDYLTVPNAIEIEGFQNLKSRSRNPDLTQWG